MYTCIAPSAADDVDAYVDQHDPPEEMAEAAREINGPDGLCTVPGCTEEGDHLDHRVASTRSGRTCVSNLFPMCERHNLSKGEKDYELWLVELATQGCADALQEMDR